MEYDLSELEAAVDPKVSTPEWRELLSAIQKRSQEARIANPAHTFSYSSGSRDQIDIHSKGLSHGARALLFFHGGGWKLGSKDDMSYLAQPLNEAGIAYIAPNYPLSPELPMSKVLPACRDIVLWVHHNAKKLGIDPNKIYIGGVSAGAQIAAYLLTINWAVHGISQPVLQGGVLLSGYYDLALINRLESYSYLGLTSSDVEEFSPMRHISRVNVPILVAWAENDPPVIKEQSRDLLTKARSAGLSTQELVASGKNHFDFPLSLEDSSSNLSLEIRRLVT